MPKIPVVKTEKLVRTLKKIGFVPYHQVGSHLQLKNKNGKRVTIPIHKGKEIKRGTLKGIINDIDFSVEEFTNLLKK